MAFELRRKQFNFPSLPPSPSSNCWHTKGLEAKTGKRGVVVKSGRCHTGISLTRKREVHQANASHKIKNRHDYVRRECDIKIQNSVWRAKLIMGHTLIFEKCFCDVSTKLHILWAKVK